ncbi:mitochondrial 54S ribosomal protein YmL37 [Starmerella bacillaris]|uniref:Large ribosomal subunit protein mL54 n=1 Tax=Starmerella bacillaris TaxID=1247836 RepID=A0AAV5RMC5_STABA|nr:mitochondrial 54S ribosomal protein YmL37 [Starmerella bacillaris]
MLSIFRRLYSTAPKTNIQSFVKAGTKLKGCNVRKNGNDPIALEDHEYPAWLWELLDPAAQQAKLDADPLLAAKKERRRANRIKIKESNFASKLK